MRMRTVFVLVCVLLVAYAQDCKTGGKRCADHEQCCGGCCFGAYRSCYSSLDVCEGHSCIGEESCVLYIPPECPGCEPVPLCRLLE
ncbi:putative tetratricopeptide repeat protein 37 [Operophtera brumata]|uniref:Putative tetratricopeptide repeat protein 37 n=1 Tax=Operophtera brumata TaxID=104452 RepID=A0A0L7LND5_OPEBR|nr:putative tetratricopeptide repeat protein 37 [Operophtera brumata]